MNDTISVYDGSLNAFRKLDKHNYNDDWVIGTLFFNRDALAIIKHINRQRLDLYLRVDL